MHSYKPTFFWTALFALSLLNSVFSQGFQVNFQGQKQQGMGCAGSAFVQDASTLFYNPGGACFASKSEVNAASTPIVANVMYVDSATEEVFRTKNPVGTPLSAYALIKPEKFHRFAYGISITTPFGSTVQYEDAWIGRFALTRLAMKVFHVQPTVSFKVTDNIGIGAGFLWSPGEVTLEKDLPVQFNDGNFGHAIISGKAMGFGYNLGIFYNPGGIFSVGFSYRSGINMGVRSGSVAFNVPEGLSANFPNGPLTTSLPLPSVITLGLNVKPCPNWNAVLDVNYVGWKTYDTLAFDYATNTSSLLDTKSARRYKNIFAFRAGLQYLAISDESGQKLIARLGGGFGFSPVQNGYLTPETPDANRWYGTAGMSYVFSKHFSVDASLYATRIKRADANLETGLNGTFTTLAFAPGLGLNYKW
jgi:long-chain fatty acid transport protein